MTAADGIRVIERQGFQQIRTSGSHLIFRNSTGKEQLFRSTGRIYCIRKRLRAFLRTSISAPKILIVCGAYKDGHFLTRRAKRFSSILRVQGATQPIAIP